MQTVLDDTNINWDALRDLERIVALKKGTRLAVHWRDALIHRYATPGRFRNGGDRRSAKWRASRFHHQALVACVEDRVRQAAPDVPDSTLVGDCLRTVQERWRPSEERESGVIEQAVQVVVTAMRRSGGDGVMYTRTEITTLRTFEQTEIVQCPTTSPMETLQEQPPVPGVEGFNLQDLRRGLSELFPRHGKVP